MQQFYPGQHVHVAPPHRADGWYGNPDGWVVGALSNGRYVIGFTEGSGVPRHLAQWLWDDDIEQADFDLAAEVFNLRVFDTLLPGAFTAAP